MKLQASLRLVIYCERLIDILISLWHAARAQTAVGVGGGVINDLFICSARRRERTGSPRNSPLCIAE